LRIYLPLIVFFLLVALNTSASVTDSTKYKFISLDSLSDEDMAMLEEYKDSFMAEVKEIKSAMLYKKLKPIDTTVALMNKASHVEISLDFASRVLSNGRDAGIKGVVFYPSAMYYHKIGFYAALSMAFFTDSSISNSARVPIVFFSPGFSRTFFNRWNFSLSYTRSFVLFGNTFQRGLLNNSFTLYNSFNFWNYLTVSVSAGISWSSNLNNNKIVFGRRVTYRTLTQKLEQGYSGNIAISLKKDFSFYNVLGAKVFTLTPELYFLFGRDNNAFLQKQYIKGQNQQTDSTYRLAYDNLFGFLNLEPGLTADWRIRNLEIYASFHCAIPFNEFVENGGVAGRITNPRHYYPYAEAGLKYLFRIKKKPKKIS